jgi:hypothetical protein
MDGLFHITRIKMGKKDWIEKHWLVLGHN